MGFGSYDESEQQQQNVDDEKAEDAAVNVHENDYEGEVTAENGAPTDDLIGQLQEIKENKEDE
ncbi:DUF5786 family protein [Natronorubrum sp. FCH18a]|uniref:DUF5786 family protein n=1 Tax=Natronorubrum sp. FCH18a TaxID=3447018 RepID=UPI003F51858F